MGPSRYSGRRSSDPLRQSAPFGERSGAFQGRRAGEPGDRNRGRRAPGEGLGGSGDLLGRRSASWQSPQFPPVLKGGETQPSYEARWRSVIFSFLA
jgi:hypothetical protein